MKRLFLALLMLAAFAAPVRAQFIGYVSPQTVQSTPFSGTTCAPGGSTQTANVANLGQTQHTATLLNVSGSPVAMTMVIQGVDGNGNVTNISDVAAVASGSPGGTVSGYGYYPIIRVSVFCQGTGTFSVNYSGSSSSFVPPVGAGIVTQVKKVFAVGAAANANFTANAGNGTFISPSGSTSGSLIFQYTGAAGPAGSTLTFACSGGLGITSTQTFSLATTISLIQSFPIQPYPCDSVSLTYVSGGASAALFNLFFLATPPGLNPNANTEGLKASYRAAISFAPPAGGATDIFVIGGSATKTVRVTHVGIACTATAAVAADVLFIKRSAADTGGTATAATLVPLDAADAASTVTVNAYTANPTINGTVGNVSADKASITTTTGAPQFYFEDFGIRNARTVVLRGTAQQLAINLNGQVIAGLACDAEAEWTEE